MSAFFSKLFTFFMSKIAKNAVFALCCEISIAKVRLRFNLLQKSCSAIDDLRCASTHSQSSLRKLRCIHKIKKLDYAFCTALLLVETIVAFVALPFWYDVICATSAFNIVV